MKTLALPRHLHTELKFVSSVKNLDHVSSTPILSLEILIWKYCKDKYFNYICWSVQGLPLLILSISQSRQYDCHHQFESIVPSPQFQVQYKTILDKYFTKDDFPIRTGIIERWMMPFEQTNILFSVNFLLVLQHKRAFRNSHYFRLTLPDKGFDDSYLVLVSVFYQFYW